MWRTLLAWTLAILTAQKGHASSLVVDLRSGQTGATKVVIVPTPGMSREATLAWEHFLEEEGFDVWYFNSDVEMDTEKDWIDGIRKIDTVFQDGDYHVLAHGYGGRFVAQANPNAKSLVLVGAPLGPQLYPTVADVPDDAVVVDSLPWPSELVGPIVMRPYPASLARVYVEVGQREAVADPDSPVFLLASGGDVVAPPECVRLPTKDWTDRNFTRLDGFSFSQKRHGELLTDKEVMRKIQKLLKP